MPVEERDTQDPPQRILHTGNLNNGYFQALVPISEQLPNEMQYQVSGEDSLSLSLKMTRTFFFEEAAQSRTEPFTSS